MRTDELWYGDSLLSVALAPLGFLYGGIVCGRRALYRAGALRSVRVAAPVIVVDIIAVGGTGKTPLGIWLVDLLRRAGKKPGVVSRGYGGAPADYARAVTAASDPREVGDEPELISLRGEQGHSFDAAQSPRALTDFAGRRVHAVAAIGRPARFFEHLRARGVQVIEHAFPDHY